MSKPRQHPVAKSEEEAAKRSRLEVDRSNGSLANRPSPSAVSAVLYLTTPEHKRISEEGSAWKQWGPYLADRQWGTIREDQSEDGNCWKSFSHDEANFRAYTAGEDGLLGICDDHAQLCQAVALWNGVDMRLKERLFGLTGPQGNHGEDVKELYYFLDSTPTHSYMRALYKYPQVAFPYEELIVNNAARTKEEPEYEILDTGIFDQNHYWDVEIEFAKCTPHDVLCQYSIHNRGPASACLHILPSVWCRNTWVKQEEGSTVKPVIKVSENLKSVLCSGINSLGEYMFAVDASSPQILFTDNETNVQKMNTSGEHGAMLDLTNTENHFKDAFHDYVIHGNQSAKHLQQGTKCAFHLALQVPPGSMQQIRCRLYRRDKEPSELFGRTFDDILNQRHEEADQFYSLVIPRHFTLGEKLLVRQAYAGLCWSKQYYNFDGQSVPNVKSGRGEERRHSRWRHMQANDVMSISDKWEFPWLSSWSTAFHMIPFADIDLDFAKSQLLLLLSDRYQCPNGQLPGCELQFDDAHPPVHAWACLQIARKSKRKTHGNMDFEFLKKCFHKLVINFNWWMNQKEIHGQYLFSGGLLGMSNISAIDRSVPPEGIVIEQADGTAWMAFYARCMMEIALELSATDCSYQDLAVTYLHHFVSITKAINSAEFGLWDEDDEFFYDRLRLPVNETQTTKMLHIRSLVGLVSLFPVILLNSSTLKGLEMFRDELEKSINQLKGIQHFGEDSAPTDSCLLSLVSYSQLKSLLQHLFDETEFLSPYGIRSLSKEYEEDEYSVDILGSKYTVSYCAGYSDSDLCGDNSNWRGPVWLCMNFMLLEALDAYGNYFQDSVNFEYPTDSGTHLPLHQISLDIRQRIATIFLPDDTGERPLNGEREIFTNEAWKGMINFYEFFNPETGEGLGACHQTGWTALIVSVLRQMMA